MQVNHLDGDPTNNEIDNLRIEPRPLAKLDSRDLAALRALLLDTIDSREHWDVSKCTRYDGTGQIVYVTESDADSARLDLCDELQRRIVAKAAPATTAPTAAAHDPDHLRPDKGGNRASDDYW